MWMLHQGQAGPQGHAWRWKKSFLRHPHPSQSPQPLFYFQVDFSVLTCKERERVSTWYSFLGVWLIILHITAFSSIFFFLQMTRFHLFDRWLVLHGGYIPHFLHIFVHRLTSSLGYCGQCHHKHWHAGVIGRMFSFALATSPDDPFPFWSLQCVTNIW